MTKLSWWSYFMGIAHAVKVKSKDPTTQVGAVAIGRDKQILATGYNGLPRRVEDRPERMSREPLPGHQMGAKYLFTAHAEENLVAQAARRVLEGSTVHVTHMCCAACTRMLINAGIVCVVVDPAGKTSMPPEQFEVARTMFFEAGVTLIEDTSQRPS